MRILAIDGDSVFRRNWEAAEGKELSAALNRTVEAVNKNREDFDRIVVAWDGGTSFRKALVPEYKAGRNDPGPAYREQRQRCIERLSADGCSNIPGPEIGVDGAKGFAESDDVLAWVAREYSATATGEDLLRIVSGDGDLEALISDSPAIDVLKPGAKAEEAVWGRKKVVATRGVEPKQIPELKALMGDKDEVPGFDGIGGVCAAKLIRQFETALAAVTQAPDDESIPLGDLNKKQRESLRTGGAELAAKGLWLATLRPELPLDYATLVLAEQERKPIVTRRETASVPSARPYERPATTALATRTTGAIAPFDPMGLQPTTLGELWDLACDLFNSRVFPQYPNHQSIMAAAIMARERGMPIGVALANTYVITKKGQHKLAHSAAYIASLVERSGLAEYFELIPEECDDKHAVVRFKKVGRPEGRYTFTIQQAEKRGWLRKGEFGDSKWITEPETMLRWAALREAARAYFFTVTSGVYMPDEIRGGQISDAEFETIPNAA